MLESAAASMIESVSFENPVFLNTLGHASGVFIFGLLIILLLKSRGSLATRQKKASLFASGLAFLWNFGSLVGLAFLQRDGQVADWLVAINFSVLSLLPAVLFSILFANAKPLLTRLGYAISLCSIVLHFAELKVQPARLHEMALLAVTVGFSALGAAALVFYRQRPDKHAFVTDVLCLVLFAISFLHFGYGHSRSAWTSEVAWHHAGIPLALIVLLRDYRLLVAETFIRFVGNMGLAGLFAVCLYLAARSGELMVHAGGDGFVTALLFVACCCALILFAYLRGILQKLITRYVFARGDFNDCSKRILQASSDAETEQAFLDLAAAEIAGFVEAERFQLAENSAIPSIQWAEVLLPLRFSRGDSVTLLLGRRRGSRRYFAEDLSSLHSLISLVVEQVERLRARELQRLADRAELQALQAQVNPHFLFNALNTLYGMIGRESFEARRLLLNLAELFRFCLRRDRTFLPLGEELEIVQAYLEIESLRLGQRLTFEISASPEARAVAIPVFSIQPLVENAIKHGISKRGSGGRVEVMAVTGNGGLRITVRDNGPGLDPNSSTGGLGIGLENVRQRLQLGCAPGSDLRIESSAEGCVATVVVIRDPDKGSGHLPNAPVYAVPEPVRR